MQPWNQVLVKDEENQYHGQAGVVQEVQAGGLNVVKLDTVEAPQEFTDDQLQVLC